MFPGGFISLCFMIQHSFTHSSHTWQASPLQYTEPLARLQPYITYYTWTCSFQWKRLEITSVTFSHWMKNSFRVHVGNELHILLGNSDVRISVSVTSVKKYLLEYRDRLDMYLLLFSVLSNFAYVTLPILSVL